MTDVPDHRVGEAFFIDQVAFVTGAASGIGFATTKAFGEAGATVVVADVDLSAARRAHERLAGKGIRTAAVHCDVTDEKSVSDAVSQTVDRFGRLDMAFNNAGIHVTQAETADVDADDFDRVMAVNLRGIFNCMKHQLRHMRDQRSGVIINCSSQSGLVGIPGLSAYTASKHGVIGLTKAAALEYATRGIRINVICPGTTETELVADLIKNQPGRMEPVIEAIPMKRMGLPAEIASAALWLSTPGAAFMTGQVLTIDGGYTAQ